MQTSFFLTIILFLSQLYGYWRFSQFPRFTHKSQFYVFHIGSKPRYPNQSWHQNSKLNLQSFCVIGAHIQIPRALGCALNTLLVLVLALFCHLGIFPLLSSEVGCINWLLFQLLYFLQHLYMNGTEASMCQLSSLCYQGTPPFLI